MHNERQKTLMLFTHFFNKIKCISNNFIYNVYYSSDITSVCIYSIYTVVRKFPIMHHVISLLQLQFLLLSFGITPNITDIHLALEVTQKENSQKQINQRTLH